MKNREEFRGKNRGGEGKMEEKRENSSKKEGKYPYVSLFNIGCYDCKKS